MTLDDFLARLSGVSDDGSGWLAHCPAHGDTHKSLRVAVSADSGKVLLKCRAGCENAEVMRSLGLSLADLGRMSGDAAGKHTVSDSPALPGVAEVAALAGHLDRWAAALRSDEGAPGREYLARRFGLTEADMARLELGYAVGDAGSGARVVVPFRAPDGATLGYQARALDPAERIRWSGPKNPDGASWGKLAFLHGSSGWDEVLVTEGPGDALTAVALGYDAIAVRGAGLAHNSTVPAELVAWAAGRTLVVAGDADNAGRRFSSDLAAALADLGASVRVLTVPEGLDLSSWRERDAVAFARELIRAITEARVVTSRSADLLAWDESHYSLSDLGGARYLRDYITAAGSGVRYCEEVGFYLLEGGVWLRDEQQRVRTHAQAVADRVRELAARAWEKAGDGATGAEKARAGRLKQYAAHAQTTRGLDSMLRELQAVEGVPASVEDFDRHPHLLAARNGVVNLRTGELYPHDPSLLLTRRVDLDYYPDAQAPRWETFLEEVFPAHPDLPGYMRRLVGYGITGSTAEQCFAVLWGTGANGKSVFTDTLTEVFRSITVTTPFSTFEERSSGGIPNDLAALKGARLVMAAEGDHGKPMAEAVLKRVTGRDLISARFMRREFFEFRPQFLLLLATNFKPAFRGQDEGLWRRVKLVPWERYFAPSERDHRLGEKLMAEAAGIFAWAVRGSVEWFRDGLNDPEVIRSSTKEYRETSDALAGFIPGVFDVEEGSPSRVLGRTLFEAYLQWADEENLPQRERWTRKGFFSALEERGMVKRKSAQGVVFEGVRRSRPGVHADDPAPAPAPAAPERPEESPLALSPIKPLQGADLRSVA